LRISSLTSLIAVLAMVVFAMVVGTPSADAACPGKNKVPRQISAKQAARVVTCLVNRKRRKHGRRKLRVESELSRAALRHSARMQRSNCFDHVCPGEAALAGRLERSSYLPCGCSWSAGENIAWGWGHRGTPRRIVRGWMKDAPHRANILGSYEHIGVGIRWGSPRRRAARAGIYTIDFGYKR
jgi:uncharacterized protein YkwD